MKVTDTLSAAKAFQKAGFDQNQSETLADQHERMAQELVAHIGEALDSRFAKIEAHFAQIEARFAQIEAKFDARIAQSEAKSESIARDQLFKFTVIVLSSVGLSVAILSLFIAFAGR